MLNETEHKIVTDNHPKGESGLVKTILIDDRILVKIITDESPSSPREDDNCAKLVCWHRSYKLGDEQPKQDPEEWLEEFKEAHPEAVLLPLFLYDHGGITMKAGSPGVGFDKWDSCQVGWGYIDPTELDKADLKYWAEQEGGLTKALESVIEGEVKYYADYLEGNVYGYKVETLVKCEHCGHVSVVDTDSCWGFIGEPDYCESEAMGIVEYILTHPKAA